MNRTKDRVRGPVTDMTRGPILRVILAFALPLLGTSVLQQVYNFTDTMIVGRCISEDALAAVGSTSALYSVMINFANGLNSGCGIVIARIFGANDNEGVRHSFVAMLLLNAVVAAALTAGMLPLLRPILLGLDTPSDIFSDAYSYIFIVIAGSVATSAYNCAAGFMRSLGNSRVPLYFLAFAITLNIGLDLLFILSFGLGVGGAALATVLAQGIGAALAFVYIGRHYKEYLPKKNEWEIHKPLLRDMFTTGLSMGLMLSVFAIGSIILQGGINRLGQKIIAAHTASRRLFELLIMPAGTIGTAMATFVSQNFGAGMNERIWKAVRQSFLIALIWCFIALFLAYGLGSQLVWILLGDTSANVMSNALLNLHVSTIFFFPLCVLLILRQVVQALGGKISPVLSSTIELVTKVVFCYTFIPRYGYPAVVFTEPVTWVLCGLFILFAYLWRKAAIRKGTLRTA